MSEHLTREEELERADYTGFIRGWAMACSTIVILHDRPEMAEELLHEGGLTLEDVEALNLTAYDMVPLRALFREMARKHAAMKARRRPSSPALPRTEGA